MTNRLTSTILPWLVATSASVLLVTTAARAERPRLVVQITIDQLRGDFPERLADRWGKGGFRLLLEEGLHFDNANYRHSATFTAVGHATLFTGAAPSEHGLAGNDWLDAETGKRVYCVEDDRHTLIAESAKEQQGTSPRNLLVDTIGDELVLASGRRSRVFSVSIKDRGAILPGGHLGKAFWYQNSSGRFVTSTYYYEAYPQWVTDWNAENHAERYRAGGWNLLRDRASYDAADRDDRPYEAAPELLGRTFPHEFQAAPPKAFPNLLRLTPMGDALTVDFAIELVDREQLGRRGETDFLALSLSATDYIGHIFGPASLEYEDNMLRLDRTLARFFAHLDRTIGLEHLLIVLSSDHGVDESPEYKASLGFASGRHDVEGLLATANASLRARFDVNEDLILRFLNPSIYLDPTVIARNKLDVAAVERALADHMQHVEGFTLALARTDLLTGNVPRSKIAKLIQGSFHATRSGNVLLAQSPSWLLFPTKGRYAAMHGSPHIYDTYVPILIKGPGIDSGKVSRAVAPRDIAPTLASVLGIKPPSGSSGRPLVEALRD